VHHETQGNEDKDIRNTKRDKWEIFFRILSSTAAIGLIAITIGYVIYAIIAK